MVKLQAKRLRERQKALEQEVEKATSELRAKNAETERQKGKIERQKEEVERTHEQLAEHHKEITDSINYAKRIQDAMLASEEHESPHFPEHYILFKPKDVVSGDYYWALEKQGYLYITVADCTGHGVPGAFMSMLGMAFLNEINASEKLLTPAEILDELRARIIKELGQTGAQGENKDGMDMSLVRLKLASLPSRASGNSANRGKVPEALEGTGIEGTGIELMWAGANNPLYHIKELDGNETEKDVVNHNQYVKVIPPNKQSIGFGYNMKPFTNHEITLQKGDSIILFTDGFADQFGGPKGKKFKYRPYMQLLLDLKDRSMEEQKTLIESRFDEWKGDQEQVDDVCVMGVKFS